MRDGNGVLFYWPVVVRPDGVMQPLPSGEIVSLSKDDSNTITMNLSEDGDNEFYNIEGPDGGVSNVVIDPRAIPIAIERPYLDGETYLRDHVNRLEIKHFQGLFVGSYFDSNNRPLYNGPSSVHEETGAFKDLGNLVVTVKDITKNFLDCDNQPIVQPDRFAGFGNIKLATCANLNGLVDKITQMVLNLVQDQLSQLRQEFDSKFDGSGANKEIIPGAQDVPYTPPDNYTTIPYSYYNTVDRVEQHEYVSTPVLLSQQIDVGTVYAIDMYTLDGGNKNYLGTLYKTGIQNSGNGPKHVRLTELKVESSSHYDLSGAKRNFVLRTLKPGENAVVTP